MDLQNYVRDIKDFPKEGVTYKDITPLLLSPEATNFALQQFVVKLKDMRIDKVVGIESRGFFFGTLLAKELNVGFIPVRKPGKLPAETHTESYDLEYGKDTLEIHADAIKKGEQILLHDDVLATGGTAKATCNLIERCGGEVVYCNFLVKLLFLNGGEKLNNYNVHSLIEY
ncbi:adenine phosphoribosyltransferase [Christiangramia aquimixticola]|uniref:adenine phosphoribosyltransferase n=1 Tax=Christiangramia aquimixticola TaxID=1697558 RepID=UPI003AA9CB2A